MKDPKDMTREELADKLDAHADLLGKNGGHLYEAAARLRNSIDRPKIEVEVVDYEKDLAQVNINKHNIYGRSYSQNAHTSAAWLRKALGMEGGA